MIEINKQNYSEYLNNKESPIYNLHDGILYGFHMDFFSKSVVLSVEITYPQKKNIKLIFQDVIFLNGTNGCFWGQDYAIYSMYIESDPEKNLLFLKEPDSLEKKPEKYFPMDDYIHTWLGILSGDVINIVCKTILLKTGDGSLS